MRKNDTSTLLPHSKNDRCSLYAVAPVLQQKTAPAAILETIPTLRSPRSPLSPLSRSIFSPLSQTSKSIRHSRSLHHKALKQTEHDAHENEAEQEHRRARELRRRRTTMSVSASVSVAAWAAGRTFGPAADVLKQIIPNALCMSPVSFRKCDGECPVGVAGAVPRVVRNN